MKIVTILGANLVQHFDVDTGDIFLDEMHISKPDWVLVTHTRQK